MMDRKAVSTVVKWPGSEADHSLPASIEVKNGGPISSLPINLHDVVFK
jgi:hypothetical protein